MSFIVEDKGGNFERCPSGMHLARCYRIVDLGTQKSEYMGQVKYLHKIMLGWEIHGTDDNGKPLNIMDGRPFAIFKNYTLSWSEKANLRLDLQSWRGKAFTQEEMRKFDLKNIKRGRRDAVMPYNAMPSSGGIHALFQYGATASSAMA